MLACQNSLNHWSVNSWSLCQGHTWKYLVFDSYHHLLGSQNPTRKYPKVRPGRYAQYCPGEQVSCSSPPHDSPTDLVQRVQQPHSSNSSIRPFPQSCIAGQSSGLHWPHRCLNNKEKWTCCMNSNSRSSTRSIPYIVYAELSDNDTRNTLHFI